VVREGVDVEFFKGVEGTAALIVGLAMIATLVAPKAQTAKVATAIGNIFTGGIREAKA
jgi:hypothetical protein